MKDPALTRSLAADPLTLETLPAGLMIDPTPLDVMYLRDNLVAPGGSGAWRVVVAGTASPGACDVRDLFARLPRVGVTAVLQCAGNGRSRLPVPAPGVQWDLGGMACVAWSGVRIADVIDRFGGVSGDRRFLTVLGGDAEPGDRRRVERSIPLDAALADAVLADRVNGEPLPPAHGGPARLVMPGYYAINSVKWVRQISLTDDESDADIQRRRYRMVPPGAEASLEHPAVWAMGPVAMVLSADRVDGQVVVSGVAFSGGDPVVAAELTIDGETWLPAALGRDQGRFAWRRFSAELSDVGAAWVAARCRTGGAVQPASSPANVEGYAVSGWRDLARRIG